MANADNAEPDDDFFDMLVKCQVPDLTKYRATVLFLLYIEYKISYNVLPKRSFPCYQGSRLDDQRCAAPPPPIRGPTVPDEDFFSLIMRSQAKRMDEQRVALPSAANSTARPSTNS